MSWDVMEFVIPIESLGPVGPACLTVYLAGELVKVECHCGHCPKPSKRWQKLKKRGGKR